MGREHQTFQMRLEIGAEPEHLLALPECVARGADGALPLLAGRPVVLTGCGTSLYAAQLASDYIAQCGGDVPAVSARTLLERAGGLPRERTIVAFSHSGGTPAVLDLLLKARKQSVSTVVVTGFPESEAASLATAVVSTGYAQELSWCHTISFSLSSLTGLLLLEASAAGGLPADLPLPRPAQVSTAVEQILAREDVIRTAAAAVHLGTTFVLSSGEVQALATETGLKLAEAAYLPNQPLELEQFFHGYIPATDNESTVIAVLPPSARTRAADLRQVASVVGFHLLALDLPTLQRLAPATDAESFPWAAAAYLQLFAYHVALRRGTDPDRLRRENPVYLAARKAYR
ncbi:MAG: SIS domain-containing protein [Thermaerobacter sp.]|nr:SIS domain-containing protein [Thermaerobacter sp.]